ncbi:hypothetical protein G7Y89_g4808 [Cudoniella acicularis]|uniref:Uncharacterized protein n=1 Tax=Cudoniella acicularis TaxID=354080 RepID=A0A8H4RQW4_9HELO|nr:hypothetical protein G7Y89_g4808 [Cudoniella acicularis]
MTSQVNSLIDIGTELKDFFDRLKKEEQKKAVRQFLHAIDSGDRDEQEIRNILSRLETAISDLTLCISVAQAGLTGTLENSLYVEIGILTETNGKIKNIIGQELMLAK